MDLPTYLPDEVAIALCIYGVDLDPTELSAILGVDPTHSHRRCERKSLMTAPYDKGAWIREVRRFEPIEPDKMLEEVLDKLPSDPVVWQRLAERFQLRVDFALHTDVGGAFVLSPSSVRRIADLCSEFQIYVQAYGDNGA